MITSCYHILSDLWLCILAIRFRGYVALSDNGELEENREELQLG